MLEERREDQMPADLTLPGLGPVHHRAYLVESIEDTASRLVQQFGAGPFFVLEDVRFGSVTSRGEAAEFSHSSAFGHLGGDPIELMEVRELSPARVAERFSGPRPRLHHLAWAMPPSSVEQVREALETHGAPAYLRAGLGDIDSSLHDTSATLGHDVEIHADVETLRGFFEMFREAAENWDGSDPIRPAVS
jgi:methylmalonyl-CoA/ethylmalonyl-CoA epimerase